MRINTNITAIMANNSLQKAESNLEKSIQRLSSGYKLNKSADDPAGCAISEKMRAQIRGLKQANNNTADGVSVLNTAEGGMIEIQSMLARMKELTVQAANDVNSDNEREAIQLEIDNMNKEIDRISNQTEFNTQPLINGNLSRRVYSNYAGVNQLEVSDGFVSDIYGISILDDARQAVFVGDGAISMSDTQTITKEQEGTITLNGYQVKVSEGDNLNTIMNNLIDASDKIGGSAFVTEVGATNDTKANGTEYGGYSALTTFSQNQLVIMTDQYGSKQSLNITCDNDELAGMLGLSSCATKEGVTVHGADVKADFTKTTNSDGSESRIGFLDSAVISTEGTKVSVRDVNNKTFVIDVPGNIAGTKFSDTTRVEKGPTITSSGKADLKQEVTDVGTMSIHVGANENQVIILDIPEITSYSLDTENINVMTGITAANSIDIVDKAINIVNEARSKIGAYTNRFEHTTNNLNVSSDNMETSLSTMIDTDMAEEMTQYTSLNVLTQAATSILSQANERPASVLQLLQG